MSASESGPAYGPPSSGAESRVVQIDETYKDLNLRNLVGALVELADLLDEYGVLSEGYKQRAQSVGQEIIKLTAGRWDANRPQG
jgi:hypothetical protein